MLIVYPHAFISISPFRDSIWLPALPIFETVLFDFSAVGFDFHPAICFQARRDAELMMLCFGGRFDEAFHRRVSILKANLHLCVYHVRTTQAIHAALYVRASPAAYPRVWKARFVLGW